MEIDPKLAAVRPTTSLNNASTPPATPDASTPPATPDASTPPAAPDASTPPATPDASTPPATPPVPSDASTPFESRSAASAPTLPAIADSTLASLSTAANTPPPALDTYHRTQGNSWADATIRFVAVRTKHDLAIHTNFIFLGVLVLAAVGAVVSGDAVYLDKVWGLLYLWFGAVIGWVLRDAKDPKRHDSD